MTNINKKIIEGVRNCMESGLRHKGGLNTCI